MKAKIRKESKMEAVEITLEDLVEEQVFKAETYEERDFSGFEI